MGLNFNELLAVVPAAIIGLTVHEFAHAYAAYKLGDSTAKMDGRLTLNPIKHIDWLGFILIIIAGFGWAKPVLINPENLKNKHRDEIIISLAGPFSNILIAILMLLLGKVFGTHYFAQFSITQEIIQLLVMWSIINIGLFVFNLLPIPPLDGSHLYTSFLKNTHPNLTNILYKYGMLSLFAIILLEKNFNLNILHIADLISIIATFLINILSF